MPATMNLIGQRFGLLQVAEKIGSIDRCGYRSVLWLCNCDCGKTRNVVTAHLRSGQVRTCGCVVIRRPNPKSLKHGHLTTKNPHPLYHVWSSMNRRCYCKSGQSYKNYGGRGITVCDRWRFGENGVHAFQCFLDDMGERPPGTSIDRINNDAGYEPNNCRWATPTQQINNRRNSAPKEKVLAMLSEGCKAREIASAVGIDKDTVYSIAKRAAIASSKEAAHD